MGDNAWGGEAPRGTPPLAARQRLELLGGFVGLFAVLALVNAVGLIIAGRPSVWASLVLLVMLVLSWTIYRRWRRVDRLVKDAR